MNADGVKLQSVQRVSEIIELIQANGPMGTTELTEALDVPTSTAHDYLSSLHGLEQRTERTVGSLEELLADLDATRERGYAVNDQEAIRGTRAVGTGIVVGESVIGAMSVVGSANRMTDRQLEDGIVDQVRGAANELELKLSGV
jgi:DNA-binding IclR family transcriptional regulator